MTSARLVVAVAVLALAAGQAMAQQAPSPPPPVPQFGSPTPTVFTSRIGFFTPEQSSGASYPRVIQLKIGPQKGILLATYARRGDLPVYRSTDNGETWQQFSEIPQLSGQPCLYELPARMGEFPAGTVLACGLDTRREPGKRSLDVAFSRDGGKSWGPIVYDVAIPDGLSRPGMPIVTRDGKGKFYMSYEW